jgi:hypothetical protein
VAAGIQLAMFVDWMNRLPNDYVIVNDCLRRDWWPKNGRRFLKILDISQNCCGYDDCVRIPGTAAGGVHIPLKFLKGSKR